MQFSCALPIEASGPDGFRSAEALAAAARAIEAAGVEACYLTDHPAPDVAWLRQSNAGAHETLNPFVAFAATAMATKHLKLHTNIVVLPYRNPFVTAKAAATLDMLSGGRLILGVAVGYYEPEFKALGVPFEERGALTEEAIKLLRQAWTGEPVTFKGRYFDGRDILIHPKPARPGGIPIWGGGNSRRAIRRAAELCDGWSPFPAPAEVTEFAGTGELSTMAHLRSGIAYLRECAEAAGRKGPLDVCTGLLDSDGHMTTGGAVDAGKAVDQYGALIEAGVNWLMFYVPAPSLGRFRDNVQWYGEEVIAKVRRSFSIQPASA